MCGVTVVVFLAHLDGIIGDGPGAALKCLFQGVKVHLSQPLHGHLEHPVSALTRQRHLSHKHLSITYS